MRLTYREFERFLLKDGYTAQEARHLFNTVKKMDKESRKWVIHWFKEGTYPKEPVEGITAERLVKEFQYKPLNAFIILNWLKEDPKAAKYFVMKRRSGTMPDAQTGQRMRELLDEMGKEVVLVMDLAQDGDVVEEE